MYSLTDITRLFPMLESSLPYRRDPNLSLNEIGKKIRLAESKTLNKQYLKSSALSAYLFSFGENHLGLRFRRGLNIFVIFSICMLPWRI